MRRRRRVGPSGRCGVSGRGGVHDHGGPEQFAHYRLDGFSADQVTAYVERWFAQEAALPEPAEVTAGRFLAESGAVEELRSNPLMLSLMCILYRGAGFIPRNRPEIFEQCTTLLFRRWDASRRIHAELQAPHLIEPAVRHLAHWLYARDEIRPTVTETQLRQETAGFLHGRGFESPEQALDASAEFIAFCRDRAWVFSDVGTTAAGERLYAFTHRTFLEYFAAAYWAGAHDSPEAVARTLAPRLARQEWGNVADLTIQVKDRSSDRGADRILTWLLSERRHRAANGRGNVLEGVARSLHYADPAPTVVRQISRATVGYALRDLPSAKAFRPLMSLLASASGWLPQDGPRRDSDYWYKFSREIISNYRDQIVQAASHDHGMLLAAYLHNLRSVKELSDCRPLLLLPVRGPGLQLEF